QRPPEQPDRRTATLGLSRYPRTLARGLRTSLTTIREADSYYRMFCFQPEYIEKMNSALRQAGLPE
ncbi:hypothetical protein ABIA85_007422, partial [Bradyrhizobium sp. LA6.10]|uniref:hypothetical protein n=1 Tax=Bradyrhizobium sp. LA6.10 TaxID=3156318 RepID=UPI0033968601